MKVYNSSSRADQLCLRIVQEVQDDCGITNIRDSASCTRQTGSTTKGMGGETYDHRAYDFRPYGHVEARSRRSGRPVLRFLAPLLPEFAFRVPMLALSDKAIATEVKGFGQ